MTRGQMKAEGRTEIMQGYGEGDKNLRTYEAISSDGQLDKAADDVCQVTDCYFTSQQENLVANQAVYCLPKIYKPKEYYCLDVTGNQLPLNRSNTRNMDRNNVQWHNWVPSDPPSWVVQDGLNYLTLAPTPSVARTNGLVLYGYALSTLPLTGRTNHQWDQDTDECPLPVVAHPAVIAGYIVRRLRQSMAVDPKSAAVLLQYWQREYDKQLGEVSTWAAKAYGAMRLQGYLHSSWSGGVSGG